MTEVARSTEPRPGRRGGQAGTTVVEFALILVVFFTLIFAVFDFSIYMNSREAVRNGIREAGRVAIVNLVPTASPTCSTTLTGASKDLVCLVKDKIGQASNKTRVKFFFPDTKAAAGNHISICAIYPTGATTGLTAPFLPQRVTSEVTLLLEQSLSFPDGTNVSEAPNVGDWNFCT